MENYTACCFGTKSDIADNVFSAIVIPYKDTEQLYSEINKATTIDVYNKNILTCFVNDKLNVFYI